MNNGRKHSTANIQCPTSNRMGRGSTPHPTLSPVEAERVKDIGEHRRVNAQRPMLNQSKDGSIPHLALSRIEADAIGENAENHDATSTERSATFLTRPEMAAALKISLRSLDRMVAEEMIPVIPVGKRMVRFHLGDVVKALRHPCLQSGAGQTKETRS